MRKALFSTLMSALAACGQIVEGDPPGIDDSEMRRSGSASCSKAPATAAVTLGEFTEFSRHPSIAAQPASGAPISDMAIKDGELYLGYGDYDGNTGPIDVATVNTSSGAAGIKLADVPTEELNTYRKFGNALYAPWIDPRLGWDDKVGFSTDASGTWTNVYAAPAIHVYDVAVFNGYTYICGAVNNVGAGIYRSNGGPWELEVTEVSDGGPTGWERFYWLGIINGKLYAQAAHRNFTGAAGSNAWDYFPLRVFDGVRWSKGTTEPVLYGLSRASDAVSFKGMVYTPSKLFNGSGTFTYSAFSSGYQYPVDFYEDGEYLYAVSSDGKISRTVGTLSGGGKGASCPNWELLGKVTMPAVLSSGGTSYAPSVTSIAVDGSTVFLGTNVGTVWKGSF